VSIEERILKVAEGPPNWLDSRELRAIALEVRKREDRIKQLEEELMDVKNEHAVLVADVVLRDDKIERIKQLEDRIHRAAIAFFRDGSDGHVASQMLQILEEERGKQ
jgi:predicted  nucleic acid-binding Zn-ribbon protein